VSGPTSDQLDALLARLLAELDDASAGLRITKEWKSVRVAVDDHAARRDALADEPSSLEDAIRTLQAQGDLLGLARDEVGESDRLATSERARREREDKAIVAGVQAFLRPYSLLSVGALVLTPLLGVPFGEWALFGAFPAVFGFLEMRRRTQLMDGRSWVILNDDVRSLRERIRLYHGISAVAVGVAGIWFVVALSTGSVS
jgi:hypothetical protein